MIALAAAADVRRFDSFKDHRNGLLVFNMDPIDARQEAYRPDRPTHQSGYRHHQCGGFVGTNIIQTMDCNLPRKQAGEGGRCQANELEPRARHEISRQALPDGRDKDERQGERHEEW